MANPTHYRRSAAVHPPDLRPASDYNPNWRNTGPAAEVLKLPPPVPKTAVRQHHRLEVNARPARDLQTLIEKLGRTRVERELNVHRTTVKRWLAGQVKIPGAKHQVIRMLLGDLPGTCGKWTGWRFQDGELLSPAGDRFDAGQVLSLVLLRQQLTQRDREIAALKVQLALAEAHLEKLTPAAANEPQLRYAERA